MYWHERSPLNPVIAMYAIRPIIAICFDTGFNNLNYFYQLFKKRFGKTPASYRAAVVRMM